MKPIKIDVEQVPEDKRDRADYLSLLASMETGMSDSTVIEAVCIHEAAHAWFALHTKMTVQRVKLPYITYDATRDEFIGYGAEVEIHTGESTLDACAVMFAAGGVASIELAASNAGDEGDRIRYNSLCDQHGVPDDEKRAAHWKYAQDYVRKLIKEQAVADLVRKIARGVRTDLENLS